MLTLSSVGLDEGSTGGPEPTALSLCSAFTMYYLLPVLSTVKLTSTNLSIVHSCIGYFLLLIHCAYDAFACISNIAAYW